MHNPYIAFLSRKVRYSKVGKIRVSQSASDVTASNNIFDLQFPLPQALDVHEQ